ncbi:MAG: triacylglycerol lipase [Deltaproteobacteria bacterium]|nr:triacylglycerol lipase [Deltaproteobacteria bacterium]
MKIIGFHLIVGLLIQVPMNVTGIRRIIFGLNLCIALSVINCCSDNYYGDRDESVRLPAFDIAAKNSEDNYFRDEIADYAESSDGSDISKDLADYFDIISEDLFGGIDSDADEISDTGEIKCPEDIVASSRYLGDLSPGLTVSSYLLGNCDAVRYSLVMAAGQEFSFYIKGTYLKPSVVVIGPGTIRSDTFFSNDVRGLPLIFSYKAARSGEYFLVLSQTDLRKKTPFSVTVSCLTDCEKFATRYPIVMVHGFSGFKNIGPVEYFYNVPQTLSSMGYDVHIAKLDPYNSTEARAPQLRDFIEKVLLETGAWKVNIIAHSQGGLDSRYVISGLMMADKTGALITVATPHYGTPLADFILSDPTGVGKAALDAILLIMGAALDSESKANAMASLYSLSVEYVTGTFNSRYPDDSRVSYYSYAGKTCRVWEDCGDTVDAEIALTYEILRSKTGDNDGIVPTESAKWGKFLGVLPADHFDEVGQVAGVTNPNFNHIEFYKSLAELLRREGF